MMFIIIVVACSSQIVASQSDRDAAFMQMMAARANEREKRDELFLFDKKNEVALPMQGGGAFSKKMPCFGTPCSDICDALIEVEQGRKKRLRDSSVPSAPKICPVKNGPEVPPMLMIAMSCTKSDELVMKDMAAGM